MVERIREGMIAPGPETDIRVLETTLVDLGVDTAFDNLNLAGSKFTLGAKKVGEDTVYVGLLNHPFAGWHFVQLLNSIAPFGDQERIAILDDVNLPIRARADYKGGLDRATSEAIRLHERHLGDPRVSIPYKEFAQYHAKPWVRALGGDVSFDIFTALQTVKFITNLNDFVDSYFSKVEFTLRVYKEKLSGRYIEALRASDLLWFLLDKGSKFGFGDFRPLFYSMNGLTEIEYRREDLYREQQNLPDGQKMDLIETFFQRNPDAKKGFVLNYFFPANCVLVDLESDCLYGEPYVQAKLVDKETLELKDYKGTELLVVPDRNTIIPGGFGWRIKGSRFSREYTHSVFHPPLYPTSAWKKREDGTRSFLTQKEAMPLIRELGLPEGEARDVKLGEIGVGYFSRDIIRKWPEKMKLAPLEGAKPSPRGDDFEQPMRGAQMPAWVAIEAHKQELLSDENPFWQIEKQVKVAA